MIFLLVRYVDEVDMPGTKVDSKQRITVRNLRIREDTAKYLRNLDPNSAYYDPKTRSMRDNPYKNTGKDGEEVDYAGENFVRFSGDTSKHAQAQLFAWEAGHVGVDVHLLAEPTKAEKLKVEYVSKKEEVKSSIQGSILERYGGEEHLKVPPKALLLAQTEHYVEYSRAGKIIKGAEKAIVCSKYEEDVYINNHHSVMKIFTIHANLTVSLTVVLLIACRFGVRFGKTVNGATSAVIQLFRIRTVLVRPVKTWLKRASSPFLLLSPPLCLHQKRQRR